MGIMNFVASRVEKKDFGYYLTFFIVGFLTAAVILSGIFSSIPSFPEGLSQLKWNSDCLWYVPYMGTLFVIFCLWMYYAPIVCRNWRLLKDAFPDQGYKDLYARCQGWLDQRVFAQSGRSWVFKSFYGLVWALFLPCFPILTVFTQSGVHHWCVVFYASVLTLIVIILNFSSCYICIMFVYFLIRVYVLEQSNPLDYVKEFPSATGGFQMLNRFASVIYLYFLLDSLLSTISYYAFWKIAEGNGSMERLVQSDNLLIWLVFLYSAVFLILFGLVTWCFIILVSRTYLHRLHNEWKRRSLQVYEKEYSANPEDSLHQEQVAAAMERLIKDKISMNRWEMLISLAALVANLVNAWSIFGPWLK